MKLLILTLIAGLSSPAFAVAQTPSGNRKDFKGRISYFQMIDEKTGWASSVDHGSLRLLRTDDGGRHWRDVSPVTAAYDEKEGYPQFEVQFGFLDENTGCVAMPTKENDGFRLYATRDGGRHWKEGKFPDPVWEGLDICYVDAQRAFIAGASDPAMGKVKKAIYRTLDGGLTWEKMSADASSPQASENAPLLPYLGDGCSISFRSATEGWCCASPRGDQTIYLYHTGDAGKTWHPQPLDWPAAQKKGYAEVEDPQFFGKAKKEGLLAVRFIQHEPASYSFATYSTHDGGKSWLLRGACSFDWNWEQVSFCFSDENNGVLICGKRTMRTSDGGKTWHEIKTASTPVSAYPVELQFITPEFGQALVSDAENKTSRLLQTHDGGATWVQIF